MDGFIYDEDYAEENDANSYFHFDRQRSEILLSDNDNDEILLSDDKVDEIMVMEEPEPQEEFSLDQERLLNIKLKKVEQCKRKLLTYIQVNPVIRFNSQNTIYR